MSPTTPSGVTRRSLLKGVVASAAFGAAGMAGTGSARARSTTVPSTEERARVVVGTGFGGSITALRLARAGVPVLVLERGIRWPTGPDADTFPHFFSPDRRAAWLSSSPVMTGSPLAFWKPYTGVMERVRGNGMDIMCGAGVGGGSLVYHGMTIPQTEANFARSMPDALDYEPFARDYYRRVARVLKPAGIPDDLLNAREYRAARSFADRITASGRTPFKVPLPIDWDFARREQRGAVARSYTNGDVLYGVNNGGKNTVDVTYLAAAEATGRVTVETLHQVRDLERDPKGRWVVHVDRISTDGVVLEHKRIVADAVFLGAGSAGTSRLLVKAQAKNLIPDLPSGVGTRWGNNGDRIFSWTPLGGSPGANQGGPACIGVHDWDDPEPTLIVHGPVPFPVDLGTTSLIGFGIVEPKGVFRYDALRDDAVLTWSQSYDAALTKAIAGRIRSVLGGGVLGSLSNITIDTTSFDTTTYHPLGGATIGDVCDAHGRVLGQRGLYVNDGALIPGSTGACNPSMTIAALAERNMDAIVAEDVSTVF